MKCAGLSAHLLDRPTRCAREGVLFLAYYGVYTAFLLLKATQSDMMPVMTHATLYLLLPLSASTLGVSPWRSTPPGRATKTKR